MQYFNWANLIKLTMPIAMGYYAAGIAFGILSVASGIDIYTTILISMVVFAGALQYSLIGFITEGVSLFSIGVSTVLISMRQVIYAIGLKPYLPKNIAKKIITAAMVTDENFSLVITQTVDLREKIILKVNFLCYFYWVTATVIGAFLGDDLSKLIPHLDFALPCLFVILCLEQYKNIKTIEPVFVAILGFIIAKILVPDYILFTGVVINIVYFLARYYLKQRKQA